jgi:hypothetical protein
MKRPNLDQLKMTGRRMWNASDVIKKGILHMIALSRIEEEMISRKNPL